MRQSNSSNLDKDLVNLINTTNNNEKLDLMKSISAAFKLGMCNLASDNISEEINEMFLELQINKIDYNE